MLFDFNNETINSHTTIYAKWNDVTANSFQVTFNTDGGSTVPSQTINGGGKATRPMNNPTKDNYDFDNWYKDADKTIPFDFDSETIEATITIYAGWIVKSTQSTSFQWSTNKGTITIDSFIGSETEVKIPQTIDGKEVTAIAEWAFPECGVISITIPNSVTSIGYGAFAGCFGLTSINVGTSNGYYSSVDGILFSKTKTELILYPEGKTAISYAIPSTVTSIGDLAFFGCINLESITIPDSVISIGYEAFNYCRSLTSITIPDDVTSIGDYAFYNCSSLASVTIGSGITSIGEGAFYYCKSLISITIPNSVTSIGYGAFYYCESLTSITIPNSVTNIGRYAFSTCDSLTNVTFENTSGWYVTTTEGAVSGTNVTTTNASTNATYLKSTYYSYYWYRK